MKNPFYLISLLFSLCILGINLKATEVIIKGKIEGFDNKTLKLGYYKNYLTNEKSWQSTQKIIDGKFSFSTTTDEVKQFILRIEDKETSMYGEPGEVYVIKLTYSEATNRGQSFNKYLDLNFPFPKLEGINQQIKKFNKAYQNFMADNYQAIMIKKGAKQTNDFIALQSKLHQNQSNSFVKNYVRYTLANLEDINSVSTQKLVNRYLIKQPILYGNKEYINFFTQLFRSDLEQLALKKEGKPLLKALMLDENLNESLKEINELKGFSNLELAELYLLNGIYETYHKKIINQQSAKKLIKELVISGSSEAIKNLSKTILESLEELGKSTNAPVFTLKNTKNQEIGLSDFRGKIVYLNFWSIESIPSLRELRVIQKLNEKYGENVHFVSINIDEEDDNKSIKEKYKFDWSFLHYGNDYELREKYQVTTIPSYFLIDEKGGMMRAFAENPVEVDRTFFNLFK